MRRLSIAICLLAALTSAGQTDGQEQSAAHRKAIPIADVAKIAPAQNVEPCLKQAMAHNRVEAADAPVSDWLAAGETAQIPWKVRVQDPELRFDQRYEVAYSAAVQGKDLRWSASNKELLFASGIMDSENRRILEPRWRHESFESGGSTDFGFQFTDCVLLQPGTYFLWIALYDPGSAQYSLTKRRVRAPDFSSDPLSKANSKAASAEFPEVNGSSSALGQEPPPMMLPISGKRQLAVDLISTLSPVDQWDGRDDIARTINNRVLAATGIFSQLQAPAGSMSTVLLDTVNRTVPFQQDGLQRLDWTRLSANFTDARNRLTVAVPALQMLDQRSTFIHESLNQRLTDSGGTLRILILISGSILFEKSSDVVLLKSRDNCRVYHVHFQVSKEDVFDDLQRMLKPLRPKTFDVTTPQEFRKTLGAIVQDLNRL